MPCHLLHFFSANDSNTVMTVMYRKGCVMRSFILNENEMNELAKRQPTPFLVLSVDKVAENYAFLRKHLPRAGIYYAIKANPHPRALERLAAHGSHFDVASAGEMEMLHAAGVDGSRMIYANPVHDARGFAAASRFGVKRFTFDDESEIPKLAAAAPGADVLVRVQVTGLCRTDLKIVREIGSVV